VETSEGIFYSALKTPKKEVVHEHGASQHNDRPDDIPSGLMRQEPPKAASAPMAETRQTAAQGRTALRNYHRG